MSRPDVTRTSLLAALALLGCVLPAWGANDGVREAIGAYLAAQPIESLRVQPGPLQDDPREDFYFVVDVRTPAEFEAGHIRGAVNVPYHMLTAQLDALPARSDEALLLYCETATRGTQALMALKLLGHRNVWYLHGGLHRWQQEGRRVETADR
jgi:rhodanese-related sulfurtransferase